MSVLLGSDYDEEGLRAIENVRDLDLDGRFPEPDLYAGEIHARRAFAGVDAERERARTSLSRFLARTEGLSTQDVRRARARSLLDRFEKGR